MAINTNAIVEKLTNLGLRHGEKAGVALASMAFFLCAGLAARMETIKTTPEQIKQATKVSQSNLDRPEARDTILDRLKEQKITDSDFAKVVDSHVKTVLVPDDYKAEREWITPEPGAGLIRDTPLLITATNLYAYPGRGGLLVYELDKDGNRIPDPDAGKVKTEAPRKKRRRRRAGGGMMGGGMMGGGMMGGRMGGQKKKKARSKADIEREQQEEYELKKKRLAQQLVGGGNDLDDAKKEDELAAKEPDAKEITKGYRWVAITGMLDHEKMLANYRQALKNPAVAHPNYKRLDLHRQTLLPDGTWTDWELVDSDENLKILDNFPEEDEELAPETVRPEGLVDPLPFMKAGLWEKVHIASLVPKEKREIAKPEPPVGGGGMMGGSRYGHGRDDEGVMGAMMGGGMGGGSASSMMGRMGMMGRGGMGGGMMGGGDGSRRQLLEIGREESHDPRARLHGRARHDLSLSRAHRRAQPQLPAAGRRPRSGYQRERAARGLE